LTQIGGSYTESVTQLVCGSPAGNDVAFSSVFS